MKPVIYLLCGLGGSGKSTYAQRLADMGIQKFSLDEHVYRQYGRDIVNYPEHIYLQHYRAAKVELDKRFIEVLENKQSAVLDYGFWRRTSRNEYKQLIEDHGVEWRLIYLKASPGVLLRRLEERNKRTDANAFPVTKDMMHRFMERFEEPDKEGEEVIEQT